MLTPLTLAETIELARVGVELHRAFLELDTVPIGEQVKGNPVHDRWRELALRFTALQGGRKCHTCGHELDNGGRGT
jgi:hypothetical protein